MLPHVKNDWLDVLLNRLFVVTRVDEDHLHDSDYKDATNALRPSNQNVENHDAVTSCS
jgi:hypothetical protein